MGVQLAYATVGKELVVKRLFLSLMAGLLLACGTVAANALVISFAVDVNGSGFAGFDDNTSGLSTLRTEGQAGTIDVSGALPVDFDVVNYILSTTGTTAPGDTIVEDFVYTIRFVNGPGGVTGAEAPGTFVDFTQSGTFTLDDIRANSVMGTFNTLPFGGAIGPSPTQDLPGFGPLTLLFKSFDFPGAPQPDPFDPTLFQGFGGKTDSVLGAVPEPGVTALLLGLLAPAATLCLRRRQR
jgi:hypothetical protein